MNNLGAALTHAVDVFLDGWLLMLVLSAFGVHVVGYWICCLMVALVYGAISSSARWIRDSQ